MKQFAERVLKPYQGKDSGTKPSPKIEVCETSLDRAEVPHQRSLYVRERKKALWVENKLPTNRNVEAGIAFWDARGWGALFLPQTIKSYITVNMTRSNFIGSL